MKSAPGVRGRNLLIKYGPHGAFGMSGDFLDCSSDLHYALS